MKTLLVVALSRLVGTRWPMLKVVSVAGLLVIGCVLSVSAGTAMAAQRTESSTQGKKDSSTKSSSKKVDINSASKDELTDVGLDDATAQKVIDARPYSTKSDLVRKDVLTQDEYDKVKDHVVAHHGAGSTSSGGKKKGGQGHCPPDCK